MWQNVNVSKKNIKLQKNKFEQFSQYEIIMPKESEYAEYYLLLPQALVCEENCLYYNLRIPPDYKLKLIKKERADGKRYARPEISIKNLEEIFSSDETKGLGKALAITSDYQLKGIIKIEGLEIGFFDETWFYSLDRVERKRRNAYGFKLVMELDEKTGAEADQFLKNLKAYKSQVSNADSKIEKFKGYLIGTRQDIPFNNYYNKITKCSSADIEKGETNNVLEKTEQDFLVQLYKQREQIDIEYNEKQKPYAYIQSVIESAISGKEELKNVKSKE